MKVLDLFSGIGGFSLGLEAAGFETVAFCEAEPYCQKVLTKNWPEVPIHDDIRQLDGRAYRGTIGLVCGGFPCQPFSTAGKRAGTNDDRHLWPEMFRIIKESRPTWVLCENVAGITSVELDDLSLEVESRTLTRFGTHDHYEIVFTREASLLLDGICSDLESIGYAVPERCNDKNRNLETAVSRIMWPTATAAKGSSPASLTRKNGRARSADRLDHAVMASDGGQLNPQWVEWLMGFPIDHTELKPSETQ